MKAPDKIYIDGFSAFATEPVEKGIEYIRKEALLEWTNRYITAINKEPNADGYAGRAAKAVLTDLIEKLNSM